MYAIIRGDLNLSAGKIASQAGHAYLDAFLLAQSERPDSISQYKTNHGIKICLQAKNLAALERAYEEAIAAGIPAVLITDLGYTVFEGQPTVTALGIGPARKEEVHHFLKRFQLMR